MHTHTRLHMCTHTLEPMKTRSMSDSHGTLNTMAFFTQGVHAGISGDILVSIFLRNMGFDLFLSIDFHYDL